MKRYCLFTYFLLILYDFRSKIPKKYCLFISKKNNSCCETLKIKSCMTIIYQNFRKGNINDKHILHGYINIIRAFLLKKKCPIPKMFFNVSMIIFRRVN